MRLKNRLFWIVAFIAFSLDQLTKFWVVGAEQYWPLERIVINPQTGSTVVRHTLPIIQGIFHFTYATNTGAAFSLLTGKVEWLRWLSLGVSLVLIAIASLGPALSLWEQLGYGFLLSGAMGNGIDRFFLGYVVDFIDFRLINFAIFNLADSFVCIGLVCLLIASLEKTPTSHRK